MIDAYDLKHELDSIRDRIGYSYDADLTGRQLNIIGCLLVQICNDLYDIKSNNGFGPSSPSVNIDLSNYITRDELKKDYIRKDQVRDSIVICGTKNPSKKYRDHEIKEHNKQGKTLLFLDDILKDFEELNAPIDLPPLDGDTTSSQVEEHFFEDQEYNDWGQPKWLWEDGEKVVNGKFYLKSDDDFSLPPPEELGLFDD